MSFVVVLAEMALFATLWVVLLTMRKELIVALAAWAVGMICQTGSSPSNPFEYWIPQPIDAFGSFAYFGLPAFLLLVIYTSTFGRYKLSSPIVMGCGKHGNENEDRTSAWHPADEFQTSLQTIGRGLCSTPFISPLLWLLSFHTCHYEFIWTCAILPAVSMVLLMFMTLMSKQPRVSQCFDCGRTGCTKGAYCRSTPPSQLISPLSSRNAFRLRKF